MRRAARLRQRCVPRRSPSRGMDAGCTQNTLNYVLKSRVCLFELFGALWLTPLVVLNVTGLVLASGCPGISAREEVYPFSVDGGRRINERKNALQPYALNGQLFR